MKNQKRITRHIKIRKRVIGTAERPRLAVFRSNRFISAQLIDDSKGATVVSAHDMKLPRTKGAGARGVSNARAVGEAIAKAAKEKKITKVVFDRAGFLYAGRIKALAEAARGAGLEF